LKKLKEYLKRMLWAAAPQFAASLFSVHARVISQNSMADWGCAQLNKKLVERFGSQVQDGPFAGLVLTPMTCAEHLGPYLLGVYESELDSAWEIVFRGCYRQIVDIGAKFGYYAVGLARKYPHIPAIAFDTDWWARRALREMASANHADKLVIKSFCSPDWLKSNLEEEAFVISDCEGYEAVLFDFDNIKSFSSTVLIIETHDFDETAITAKLQALFAATHTVRVYESGIGRRKVSAALDFLSEEERLLAANEVRPAQKWLLCLPKLGANQSLNEACARML